MSDVEQGGGTVFTAINIALWPKKGSAAFWYNLKPNGEGDFKTRHAACPVLTGSKWGMWTNKILEFQNIHLSFNIITIIIRIVMVDIKINYKDLFKIFFDKY